MIRDLAVLQVSARVSDVFMNDLLLASLRWRAGRRMPSGLLAVALSILSCLEALRRLLVRTADLLGGLVILASQFVLQEEVAHRL